MLFVNAFSIALKLAKNTLSSTLQKSPSTVAAIPIARKLLIESIVRVDHAGELAADQIYAGQLSVLHSNSRIAPIIEHMWEQEREHLDIMEQLLAKYDVKPTIFAPLCGLAGYALGNLN